MNNLQKKILAFLRALINQKLLDSGDQAKVISNSVN